MKTVYLMNQCIFWFLLFAFEWFKEAPFQQHSHFLQYTSESYYHALNLILYLSVLLQDGYFHYPEPPLSL